MASLKRLLFTLTSIVAVRLELLGNELEEERLRLTQMLLFSLFAMFCFGMGILLITVFIVVLFWEDHRLLVTGMLGVFFFILGTLFAIVLRHKSQERSGLFSASLAELANDREHLDPDHE